MSELDLMLWAAIGAGAAWAGLGAGAPVRALVLAALVAAIAYGAAGEVGTWRAAPWW